MKIMTQPEQKFQIRKVGHLVNISLATGHSLAVMYGGFSPWWVTTGVVLAVVGFLAMEA